MSDLDPVTVLQGNAAQARARAITLEERAEIIEADPELAFATVLLRRNAKEHRDRAAWLKAEADRLAEENL